MNRVTYAEPMSVEMLVRRICDYKQQYTQFGGVRPFGTALLVGGYDDSGLHLFETEPSGSLTSFKAASTGGNKGPVMELFEQKDRPGLDRDAAILLALEGLRAGLDEGGNLSQVEICTLQQGEGMNRLGPDEVQKLAQRLPPARLFRPVGPLLGERPGGLPMVKVEDAVIARWETGGSRFEVLVDPAAVQELKDGKDIDLADKLALEHVFKDAKKGDKISEEYLERTFHTRDIGAIAKQIVLKGEVQVTTEQRRALQETKRKQVVATIARNAMNPQTGAPHPPARIEAAMVEAKVHIDPFRPVDAQVQEVLDKLRPADPDPARRRQGPDPTPRPALSPRDRGHQVPRTAPPGGVAFERILGRCHRDSRRCADRVIRETQRANEGRRRDGSC